MGADPLAVYKKAIESAVSFDWNKPVRLTDARKAVADYRKAIGKPEGMLELQVFFCERAMAFSMEFGFMDDAYASAIAMQFAGAAGMLKEAPTSARDEYVARLRLCGAWDLPCVAHYGGNAKYPETGDYFHPISFGANTRSAQWTKRRIRRMDEKRDYVTICIACSVGECR